MFFKINCQRKKFFLFFNWVFFSIENNNVKTDLLLKENIVLKQNLSFFETLFGKKLKKEIILHKVIVKYKYNQLGVSFLFIFGFVCFFYSFYIAINKNFTGVSTKQDQTLYFCIHNFKTRDYMFICFFFICYYLFLIRLQTISFFLCVILKFLPCILVYFINYKRRGVLNIFNNTSSVLEFFKKIRDRLKQSFFKYSYPQIVLCLLFLINIYFIKKDSQITMILYIIIDFFFFIFFHITCSVFLTKEPPKLPPT